MCRPASIVVQPTVGAKRLSKVEPAMTTKSVLSPDYLSFVNDLNVRIQSARIFAASIVNGDLIAYVSSEFWQQPVAKIKNYLREFFAQPVRELECSGAKAICAPLNVARLTESRHNKNGYWPTGSSGPVGLCLSMAAY